MTQESQPAGVFHPPSVEQCTHQTLIKDTHKHTHVHKGSSTTQDFSALTFPGPTASIKTSWLPCKVMKVDFTNLTVIASSASVSDTWWFLDLYPFADAAVYWHCVGRSRQRWDQGFALLNKKYKDKKKVVDINTEGAHGGTVMGGHTVSCYWHQ